MSEIFKYSIFSRKNKEIKNLKNGEKKVGWYRRLCILLLCWKKYPQLLKIFRSIGATGGFLCKKLFIKSSKKNNCVEISLQVKYCKIFKNTYAEEHLLTAGSADHCSLQKPPDLRGLRTVTRKSLKLVYSFTRKKTIQTLCILIFACVEIASYIYWYVTLKLPDFFQVTRKSIGKIFGFYYKILFLRKIVKITETITTSKFLRSWWYTSDQLIH